MPVDPEADASALADKKFPREIHQSYRSGIRFVSSASGRLARLLCRAASSGGIDFEAQYTSISMSNLTHGRRLRNSSSSSS